MRSLGLVGVASTPISVMLRERRKATSSSRILGTLRRLGLEDNNVPESNIECWKGVVKKARELAMKA